MDWVLFGMVVVWLGILSWFDIRKSEIPHSAWVVIPLLGACFYRAGLGGWALILLTVMVVAASERDRMAHLFLMEEIAHILTWFPLLLLGFFFAVQFSPVTALAIIGFWAAWELKVWGGADATAAITLVLVYPGLPFILALLGVHLITAIGLAVVSWIRARSLKLHRLPGLPLLLLAVVLGQVYQLLL